MREFLSHVPTTQLKWGLHPQHMEFWPKGELYLSKGKTSHFNGSAVPAEKKKNYIISLAFSQATDIAGLLCPKSDPVQVNFPSKKCCDVCHGPLSHGLLLQECRAPALESTSQDRYQECNVVVGQLTLRGISSFCPQRLGLRQVRRHCQNPNGLSASYTDVLMVSWFLNLTLSYIYTCIYIVQ